MTKPRLTTAAALEGIIAPPMDLDPAVASLRQPFWQLRLLAGTMPSTTARQQAKLASLAVAGAAPPAADGGFLTPRLFVSHSAVWSQEGVSLSRLAAKEGALRAVLDAFERSGLRAAFDGVQRFAPLLWRFVEGSTLSHAAA